MPNRQIPPQKWRTPVGQSRTLFAVPLAALTPWTSSGHCMAAGRAVRRRSLAVDAYEQVHSLGESSVWMLFVCNVDVSVHTAQVFHWPSFPLDRSSTKGV